jgi:hypothetical protein
VGDFGTEAAPRARDHSKLEQVAGMSSGPLESTLGSGKHQPKNGMSATVSVARHSEFTPLPAGG